MTSPLAGKRVLNTRAAHQSAELDRFLRDHGAVPLSFPCIAITPPADRGPLDAALRELVDGGFDWVVFTSANTVEAVAGRLGSHPQLSTFHRRPSTGQAVPPHCHPERSEGSLSLASARSAAADTFTDQAGAGAQESARGSPTAGFDASTGLGVEPGSPRRAPLQGRWTQPDGSDIDDQSASAPAHERLLADLSAGVEPRATALVRTVPASVAVVGPATAEAVSRLLGWPVHVRPEVETAADLGRSMPVQPGDRVLLPKSALAGPALAAILRGRGAGVTEVVAYEAKTGAGGVDLASLLAAGEVDAICFTSGSTVRGCLDRLGGAAIPDEVRIACIGTETAAVAASLGLTVAVVPAEHTASAMVAALAAAFGEDRA